MIVAALVLMTPACSSDATAGSPVFDLSEFEVNGPGTLTPGETSVTVTNSGEFPHTLVIAEANGSVVAATEMIQPGETVTIEVDLESTTYQFSCRIVGEKPDGTIVDHFEEGMLQTVSVGS